MYNYPKNMYTYNISSKFFDRDILSSKVKKSNLKNASLKVSTIADAHKCLYVYLGDRRFLTRCTDTQRDRGGKKQMKELYLSSFCIKKSLWFSNKILLMEEMPWRLICRLRIYPYFIKVDDEQTRYTLFCLN